MNQASSLKGRGRLFSQPHPIYRKSNVDNPHVRRSILNKSDEEAPNGALQNNPIFDLETERS